MSADDLETTRVITPEPAPPPSARPPASQRESGGVSSSPKPASQNGPAKDTPAKVEAAELDDPALRVRPRRARPWLWVALPITGLLVLPTVGLLYAATTSFGVGEPATDASGAPVEPDEEGAPAVAGKAKPNAKSKRGASNGKSPLGSKNRPAAHVAGKPRTDDAGLCCTKLRELGKTAEVAERAPYLSAAASCEAATDADIAYKRVQNQLTVAKLELPPECDH